MVTRLTPSASLDPTFDMNSSWPLVSIFQGGDYHVFPDGRVLVTGSHDMNDPVRGFVGSHQLIWFQNNGYLDTTRVHRQGNGILWTLKEQPDGKFLVSCTCTFYDGQAVSPIFRIHHDGSLDTSFSVPLEPWGYTYDMHTYADGTILVAGTHMVSWRPDTLSVFRLLPNGDFDPTFEPVPGKALYAASPAFFPTAYGLLPLDDGLTVVVGNFDHLHGEPRGGIALLNNDGSLSENLFADAAGGTYTSPGGPRRVISDIVPAPDGSYYIHGVYHGYNDGTINDTQQRFVSRLYGLNVGVQEQALPSMAVYPNPASGHVTVDLKQPLPQGMLVLRDALGREVLRQRVAGEQNMVGLQGLAGGVYVFELWDKNERLNAQRLLIE